MTLTPEMVEIAPCPFDGNYLQLVVLERDDYCCVVCEECDCDGPAAEGRTEAIKSWNARAQPQRAVGWMPIDTAPKDEATNYLVLIPGNDVCEALALQVSNFEGGTYADCRDGLIDWKDRVTTATHWMPVALIDGAGGGV